MFYLETFWNYQLGEIKSIHHNYHIGMGKTLPVKKNRVCISVYLNQGHQNGNRNNEQIPIEKKVKAKLLKSTTDDTNRQYSTP